MHFNYIWIISCKILSGGVQRQNKKKICDSAKAYRLNFSVEGNQVVIFTVKYLNIYCTDDLWHAALMNPNNFGNGSSFREYHWNPVKSGTHIIPPQDKQCKDQIRIPICFLDCRLSVFSPTYSFNILTDWFVTASRKSVSPISDNSFIHVTLQDALFLLLQLRIYYLSEKLSAKRQAICLSKYIAMCGLKYDWRGRSGLEPSAKLRIPSILSFKVTLDPFSNTPRCPACLFRNVNVIITLFIWQNDTFFDGYLCRYTCH